jgi:hypothetical protein
LKIFEPSAAVFLDVELMAGGQDFTKQLRNAIEEADVFLLLIGPYWHSDEGRNRIHKTGDVLRREVAWAMRKEVPIIPVLLENTNMPGGDAFPEQLAAIPNIHAERLRSDHFESDWGNLLAAIVDLMRTHAVQELAIEQELEELEELLERDPEAGEKRMSELFDSAVQQHFHKYLPAKSERGEGISTALSPFGVWECVAKGPGTHITLRLIIEDQSGSPLIGEYRIHDAYGRVARTHQLSGEWAQVMDVEANLFLGFYLNGFLDNGERVQWTIPFHEKVGDTFIGNDAVGLHYTSRNVEPRVDGF